MGGGGGGEGPRGGGGVVRGLMGKREVFERLPLEEFFQLPEVVAGTVLARNPPSLQSFTAPTEQLSIVAHSAYFQPTCPCTACSFSQLFSRLAVRGLERAAAII